MGAISSVFVLTTIYVDNSKQTSMIYQCLKYHKANEIIITMFHTKTWSIEKASFCRRMAPSN